MPPTLLSRADFSTVVRLTPLVAIDLIIRDSRRRALLGLRMNNPAKGFYFVPGGRICKDERLGDAFVRILKTETGYVSTLNTARFLGAYEHFYEVNSLSDPGYGTHYVVLAYQLEIEETVQQKSDAQHSVFVWRNEPAILASDDVHENTKAYFR
jgi:colanic acid biosynthesis protein WcaH